MSFWKKLTRGVGRVLGTVDRGLDVIDRGKDVWDRVKGVGGLASSYNRRRRSSRYDDYDEDYY
jgi:hypothetical protein